MRLEKAKTTVWPSPLFSQPAISVNRYRGRLDER